MKRAQEDDRRLVYETVDLDEFRSDPYVALCARTSGPTSTATAAVVAEIMPGRPLVKELKIAIATEA
jgi:hypothetical protein